jgi:hypothetical protein
VVAIFSYDGGLYFGVTGDYDGAPDIEILTQGIHKGIDDLLAIAGKPKPKPTAVGARAGARRERQAAGA